MPRRLLTVLAAALAGIVLSGCASTGTGALPVEREAALKTLAARHHVCAVTLAVIKARVLHTVDAAAGCSPASKPDPDSVFQAASLSKPVFAYGVLKLVAEGRMDLDAPVLRYLPQDYRHPFSPLKATPAGPISDPRLRAVTVRMILNHTSGLPNWASGPLYFESDPGRKWTYSGEGYLLLQRAVERVTGQPLDRFMTERVFKPLGMQNSDFVWSERIAAKLQAGRKANGRVRTTLELKEANAAFSLFTTAADYGKFLVALLNDEALFRQIGVSPATANPKLGIQWGLGWGMEQAGEDGYVWQWGNNTGYRAFVMASSRTGDGFVMLTNSENGLKLAQPLARNIFGTEHRLFQSPMLGDDPLLVLCNSVRLCL